MYLIDGYNLLYQTNYNVRDELVSAIDSFCRYHHRRAVIIFDGFSPIDLSTDIVQVYFDPDADARILEYIDREASPSDLVLITSDKELSFEARQKKVQVIRSENFEFSLPPDGPADAGEKENFYISDDEIESMMKQLKEFKKITNIQ